MRSGSGLLLLQGRKAALADHGRVVVLLGQERGAEVCWAAWSELSTRSDWLQEPVGRTT